MPAVDPFSASFVPWVARDKPVRDTTLRVIDQNVGTATESSATLPKPRRYKDTLPTTFYVPPYSHSRSVSSASIDTFESLALETGRAVSQVGSDQWMHDEVSQCLYSAKGDLDVKGKGLTTLSTRIAELNDVVSINPSLSPLPSSPIISARSPLARQSPSYVPPSNETLSPGAGPYSANSRPFMRHVSAPVSAQAFNEMRRATMDRQPSGLRTARTLLDSPTLTETSEDGSEPATTPAPTGLLASPSLDAPPRGFAFGGGRRELGRSKTGAALRVVSGSAAEKEVSINAAQNLLTSLPSALFEIHSLTSLTLRSNRLVRLPAAIGDLQNLKELNIGNNKISELPSTILNLQLEHFHVHPNTWLKRPETDPIHGRILGPLVSRSSSHIPSLYTLCANLLITPRLPSNMPPMLDGYSWSPQPGEPHPLLDSDLLHSRIPYLSEKDWARALQAMRSASNATSRKSSHAHGRRSSTASNAGSSGQANLFPRTHKPLQPDDAAENPYYWPCPNKRHLESSDSGRPPATRRLFLHAAEKRLEWMTVCGHANLPIRWRGCSPGCLAFLEQKVEVDDELWGLSDEED